MNNRIKIALTVLGVIMIVFIMIFLETSHRARESYKEAETAYQQSDYDMAIVWYGTVIRFYTPGSMLVAKAKDKLFEIGELLEKKGDYKKASEAYGEVVHGIYAVRSFYTPHKDWQNEAIKRVKVCKGKVTN
ncbi:MAG: hypothetical protein ABH886_04310 [Candidatus Desantisbacteria bacterium]